MLKKSKEDNSKLYAFIATFLSIVGFVIALLAWRNDKYVMHYAKQSLIVFVVAIIGAFVQNILAFIPVLGKIIETAIGLIILILWIFSWVYALSGEKKEVPIVGVWGRKINL